MPIEHPNAILRSRAACRARMFKNSGSVIALAAALAAGFAFHTGPAWADGGRGAGLVGFVGGAGGMDGTATQAIGQDGAFDAGSSSGTGGGGGAVDLTTGFGAHGGAHGIGGIGTGGGAVLGTPGATGAAGAAFTAATTISAAIAGGVGGMGQTSANNINTSGGSGGGGVGVTTTADITIAGTGNVRGGAGAAQISASGGGGGGGGGAGLFSSAAVTVAAGGQVTGGAGGGSSATLGGGEGGMGVLLVTGGGLVNGGAITGGAGGTSSLGGGGDGGAGIWSTGGDQIVNATGASITGGVGGAGRFNATGPVLGGLGGAGVKGANITLINAGAITGAMGGTTAGGGPAAILADAVQFTGGTNVLEIQSGSTITGNVVAFSTADTLRLGGDADASFNVSAIGTAAQYQGFGLYEKTGNSVWTLTGTTAAVTPWTLSQGTLSISDDAALGDASSGVTFNGGVLQFGANVTSARAITVNATGGTIDTQGNSDTLSGVIAGPGALAKTGSGTLILTGANTYSGGTMIAAGILQLGDGGASGGIAGDVTDNATLAFDRLDAITFGGAISGTGVVAQTGMGITTLTGTNTYAGGTTISGGTLTGSAASFGSGAILDNAALVIDQPADASFTNPLNGSGSFVKQGAGRLNLTGTGTLSGPTTVTAGTLAVNGSLANSAVTVAGGTLGGNGTVGAVTVRAGGAIAPGNSIGTLHVDGALVQELGSIYQAELDPASNASDLIAVNGAATLANGASLNVTRLPAGDYRVGAHYTVLSASGGVTGAYALTGDTSTAFLALQQVQDADNIYLNVVQTRDPADAAQTSNQTGVAGAVDSLPSGNAVSTGVLNSPSDAAARSAFDNLSGEALASSKGALVSGSLLVRDTTFDRLRDVFCGTASQGGDAGQRPGCAPQTNQPTLWAQGFGNWGHTSGNANAAGLSQSTGGFLVGVDVPVYDWRVGYFGGYSRTDFDVKGRSSSGVADNYHLGLYGGTQWDDIGLRLGASYSWSNLATDRSVAVGSLADNLKAAYNAGTAQIFGELGQRFALDQFTLEPFANLAYVNLRTDGFSETGGDAALTSRADTMEDGFATLGVRPSTEISLGSFTATAHGMAGWRHAFGDVTPSSTVSFAGSNAFTVSGAPIARDAGVVEAGLAFNVTGNAAIGLTYGGQFGGGETENSIRGTLAWSF